MMLRQIQTQAWQTAEEKGFHEARSDSTPTALALIHSEVSEALEADRDPELDNFGEELADIVIRVADLSQSVGIDLEKEVVEKMEENMGRDFQHGKEY